MNAPTPLACQHTGPTGAPASWLIANEGLLARPEETYSTGIVVLLPLAPKRNRRRRILISQAGALPGNAFADRRAA